MPRKSAPSSKTKEEQKDDVQLGLIDAEMMEAEIMDEDISKEQIEYNKLQ